MEGGGFQRQRKESYLQTLRKSRRLGIHSCLPGMTTVTRQGRDLPAGPRAELLPSLPAAGSQERRVRALAASANRRLVRLRQLPQEAGRSNLWPTAKLAITTGYRKRLSPLTTTQLS